MTATIDRPTAAVTTQPRSRRSGRRIGAVVAGVIVLIALVWSLAPIYWMVATSFKGELEVAQLNPTLWPHQWTLGNYAELSGHSLPFMSFLVNSIVTSLIAAVVAVFISALAGYSLSRGRYRLRGPVGQVILATRILPLVVLVAPLYLLLLKAHLLDSYLGLIIGYTSFALPFGAWMMKGFIDAVPTEVEEAARVDGYRRLGILIRVVIPMTVPGLLTTATFVFMDAWNNLLYPLTLISTEQKQTLPPGLLDSFTGQFKTDWGGMMAAACITSIPLLIAFFAVQRYMVRGLTAGALAGE
jgi:ABC-type glycerol-3-phosphate transport system permease component